MLKAQLRLLGPWVLLVVLLLTVAPCLLSAQQAHPSPAAAPQAGAQELETEAAPAKPEAVKAYTLSPEKYEKAIAYSRANYRLYFIGVAWGLLMLWLVLRFRVAAKFRDWAERVGRRRFVQVVVFAPMLLLALAVLNLPLDLYSHQLQLQYEQSVQSWGSWFGDWGKGRVVTLIIGTLLVWILYGVIRRSPRRWWFYFWLASIAILIFVLFISPYVIQPLFYDFTLLAQTQPELVAQIERVVERAGMQIPRERMFEMKASAKLKSLNAQVTGLGASKRVVVWDTTIQKLTVPETLFVFGHEMGHYVLYHLPKGIALMSGFLLVFLYLSYRLVRWSVRRWGERCGIRELSDWASLPLLLIFVALIGFFFSPVSAGISRYFERQCDTYGVEVINGIVPDRVRAAARAFQVLGEINLADPAPHPFIRFWLYSHPPISERIAFVLSYDPWSKGQEPEFVRTPPPPSE